MTDADMDTPHAPYRPPEAVIEPLEPLSPGRVPGIIAEYPVSDDEMTALDPSPLRGKSDQTIGNVDAWQANLQKYNMMSLDDDSGVVPERPQVGPGILPRRWLQLVHKHELLQPVISELPVPPPPKQSHHTSSTSISESPLSPKPRKPNDPNVPPPPASPTPSAKTSVSAPSMADYDHISTLGDVWDACPGGEGGHQEWFFCATCWGWIRVVAGRGELPTLSTMDEWQEIARLKGLFSDPADLARHRNERLQEWSRLNDIKTSKMMTERSHHHLHECTTLVEATQEERIERVPVDAETNAFPHLTFGMDQEDDSWTSFSTMSDAPRLYVSCSSDLWLLVDAGPVPGQLPVGLVNAFTTEKMINPSPGMDGSQSVSEAWTLIAT